MARYSRRSGPSVAFELTASLVLVPGMTITRFFDAGELLIAYNTRIDNGTVGDVDFVADIVIDGVSVQTNPPQHRIPAGGLGQLGNTFIASIDAGEHTIELRAGGAAAVGDNIPSDSTFLSVIQLPLWDQATDIT